MEKQFNPETALKVLQQHLVSFDALRQQTLQKASSVQSEINEIFNSRELDTNSHQFKPFQQSPTCNHEDAQLSKGWGSPGVSSPSSSVEHSTSIDKTDLMDEIHVNKMNEGLIQNDNSLLLSSEDNSASLLSVSLLEEHPLENKTLQHMSNQTVYKTSFPVCGSGFPCHSAALSTNSNLNSSLTSKAVDGHDRSEVHLLQYNNESRAILEKICIASEQMKLHPERSQNWELILNCELKRLQSIAQLMDKETAERSTQTPHELSLFLGSLNLQIKVDNKEKTLELETLVTRLQSVMEGCKVDLHRQLGKGNGFNGPHYGNHWTETENNAVIYDNQMEERINEFIFLQETPESISSHESTLERASLVCHMEKQKGYSNKMVVEKMDEISAPADGYASWLPLSEYRNRLINGFKLKDEKSDIQSVTGKLTTFDSVLQENSEYKSLVSKLAEEKRTLQAQFNEMEGKRKICIEEFNSLLRRHEDLQRQNRELEAERQQLITEKESFIRLVDKMTEEKEDLLTVIDAKETVLQLEKTKEAVQAVNANSLQFENLQMNQSLNELKKETIFLRNELEKTSCEMQCTKAKYAVMRTKNLMLFQLVQEVKNKNYKLEKSLKNSVPTNKYLQKDVDEVKMEKSTMKDGSLNEMEQVNHGKKLTESCSSDLVKKCEMMSKVVEILTEENQILNQDLEKYIKANLQLECIVRMLNEEWRLWGKQSWSTEQEMNFLHPEMGKVHTSYLSDVDNSVQFSHQRKEDEMSGNQLNRSDISLNATELSVGESSWMALCSNPKDQRSVDEIGQNFKELLGEQGYEDIIQQGGTVSSSHSTTTTDWKTWNSVGGSGDASEMMNDPNLPLLCIKQHSHGFDGKSTPPLLGKENNWRFQNLECGLDETLKTPDPQS